MFFYIPYKICKHSLKSIDFTASVYELFDNPSYIVFLSWHNSIEVTSIILAQFLAQFCDIFYFSWHNSVTYSFYLGTILWHTLYSINTIHSSWHNSVTYYFHLDTILSHLYYLGTILWHILFILDNSVTLSFCLDTILCPFYYLGTILWHTIFILAHYSVTYSIHLGIIQWHTLLKLTQFCYKFCLPWHTSFPCGVIGLEHVSQTIKSCCQFLLDLFCNLQGQQRNNDAYSEFLAQSVLDQV